MTSERIDKAIEIINYAIQNQITVTEASVKCGFAYTYVKNVKAIVYEKYENGTLEDELFNKFDEAYKEYEKSWHGDQRIKPENKPIFVSGTTILFKDNNTELKIGNDDKKPTDIPPTNKKPTDIPSTSIGENLKYVEDGDEAIIEWKSGANYPADHIKTLDELLTATKVDLKLWKVKDFTVNKWDVTSWRNKFPETVQNYQVKARLERDILLHKEHIIGELFKEMIKTYNPPVLHVTPSNKINTENNIFEVTLFDLHLGKLAWGGETFENYDTKIARSRYLTTIETLIHRASGFQYEKILFPIGSDFFNSDTIYNTTTKGTPQDEDLRWQKTFMIGCRLLVDAINLLKQTGVIVDVMVIPGNHDFERSYYMGAYLEAWFNCDPMVKINNGASPRKYYRFGNVLLGFTHGSEEKESSLPLIMATDIESKPLWSETKFHEFHVGHIHRKRDMKYTVLDKARMTNEDLGVTIRYLSSLTGTEEWHHKKGFVGATKAGEAFIWNKESGLIAHLNANLIIE